jgi:enoyl-CoA hydratase
MRTVNDTVKVDALDDGAIRVITLNRPEARNSLDPALAAALPAAVRACDEDPATRVIVITGADPAFCGGFDVRAVASGEKRGENPHPGYWTALPPTRVPIIGAVNGAAVTGGLEIALACDFLIASDRARFADTHAKMGMVPGWGLTVLLPRIVGATRARRMSLTAEFVDADTALAWGLVTEVVPHELLMTRAIEIARATSAHHAGAVAEIRALYRDVAEHGVTDEAFGLENGRARAWAARRSREIREES